MNMSRIIQEKKLGAGRVVAVAIENNKTSQYAAKWAVDNLLPKDQCLLLIHVKQKASSIATPSGSLVALDANDDVARAYKQQMYNETRELFASFRVFCNRKSIQCQEILLEDTDVAKAIVEAPLTTKPTICNNALEQQYQLAPSPDRLDTQLMRNHPPRCMSISL
ncbi:unnamed protein product [Lupinus luteus]|uniref:RING-type E3 ubiquitin transferase n=1 Tax=Lupinus luteus TaxID=3873 RepID=A0AAV1WVM4_LUPLU